MLPSLIVPFSILGAFISSEGSCIIPSSLNLLATSITTLGFLRFCVFTIFFKLYLFKSPTPLSYIDCIESPKKPITFFLLLCSRCFNNISATKGLVS